MSVVESKYLFGVREPDKDGVAEVHIVPTKHWEEHHQKYPGYIPDNNLADMLESEGFIECMENVYEFSINTVSIDNVINLLITKFGMKHSSEFQEIIN